MMWRITVLCLSLSLGLASSQVSNTFVVTFPCTVHPGVDTSLSVAIIKATQDVNVTAAFHSSALLSARDKLSETTVMVAGGQSKALSLQTPSPPSGSTKLYLSVTGSGGLVFTDNATVTVGKRFSIFVQTDKGVYRPGQTIRMRVVAVLPDLMPYTGSLKVSIEDKDGNRMAQWTNAALEQGVWTADFPLSAYPILGNWTIKAEGRDSDAAVTVEIREYVLPKYEVTLTTPGYIAKDELSSQPITVDVSAKYTYGKPVQGSGSITLFLNNVWQSCSNTPVSKISRPFSLTKDGKASLVFSSNDFYQLFCSPSTFNSYSRGHWKLVINASVSDSLTGEIRSSTKSVGLYGNRIQAKFDRAVTQNTIIPGTNYEVRILVNTPDDKPLDNVKVHLKGSITRLNGTKGSKYQWTPVDWSGMSAKGVVTYSLPVPQNAHSISLNIEISGAALSTDNIYPTLPFSPSKTYLSVRADKANYAPQEMATFTARATTTFKTLFYTVYSRGYQVQHAVASTDSSGRTAVFTVQLTPSMAPNAKVVAYFVDKSGEVIVDSLSVTVSNIFKNNVNVLFNVAEARPNANVTLSVSADNGSFVAVSVVDQSTLLLRQSNDISASTVTEEVASYDGAARPMFYDGPVWALAVDRRRKKRLSLPYPWYYGGASASEIFRNAGMCVVTDCALPQGPYISPGIPERGVVNDVPMFADAVERSKTSNTVGQSLAVVDHTRDYFPETWLWTDQISASNSRADFQVTVPDTITSWVASAFAVSSSSGLGVASSSAKLKAFQQFFLSLNLPYSVIRGEQLLLQVNVFNYLTTSQETTVSISATNELNVVGTSPGEEAVKVITIGANQAASVFFIVVPTVIGHVPISVTARSTAAADGVKRQLLVEAEGAPKSYSRGIFIDLTNTNTMTERLMLSVPSNVVPASARAVVSVIGDIMGPALANLDKLLKMPYGCGEQNMLNFAPDIFIIKYLTAIGQASSNIIAKAKRYMIAGYQRELTYRRSDYSFSAFGNRDKTGSIWLTAFVVKSFAQASSYIFIDTNVIKNSLRYLVQSQNMDGSFPLIGMVHHQGMKGGLQGDVARTAYILTTFVEAQSQQRTSQLETSGVARAVKRARAYLEKSLTGMTDNYTLAISAYALKLAQSSSATRVLQMLMARADRSGGTLHWKDSRTKTLTLSSRWRRPWYRAPSADVELTAYGLLALVKSNDMTNSLLVAKWLSAQRNAYGGFDSTQDTVVALQALAELAGNLKAEKPAMTVKFESNSENAPYSQSFSISSSNFLVLQQTNDVPVPSELIVTATGSGTALLSVQVFYNIKGDDVAAFDVTSDCDLWKLTTSQQISATCTFCAKLSSDGVNANAEGMSLLEIGMPSGFSAIETSLSKLLTGVVKRYELPDRRVVLYVDELTSSDLCVKFDIEQDIFVSRLQATPLRAINYYDPSLNSVRLFNVSDKEIPICCQCATCDGCATFDKTLCPDITERQPSSTGTKTSSATGACFFTLFAAVVNFLL